MIQIFIWYALQQLAQQSLGIAIVGLNNCDF